MKDLKLIEILKTLSKKEIKDFDTFIRSPFFSRGRNLVPLYNYIKTLYPLFNSSKLTGEAIYRVLYPGRTFITGKSGTLIRKLISELSSAAEEFLMYQSLKNDKGKQYIIKLQEFCRRDLHENFMKTYTSAEEFSADSTFTIAEKNKFLYEILELKFDYYADKGKRGMFRDMIEEANKRLLEFFYFTLIINLQAQNTEKLSSGTAKKNSIVNNFIDSFDFDKFALLSKNPIIEIYHLFMLENTDRYDLNTVLKLFRLLGEYKDMFCKKELHDLYTGLAAMCTGISTLNKGKTNTKQLLLNIYKSSAKNDVLLNPRSGKIDLLKFRNVLDSALSCKEHDFAEQFVNSYLSYLPKETIKNTKALSLALLEYSKGNFQKALDMLSGIRQNNFTFIHDLKFLQMKCYYDLNYFDNADSLISSYREYIKYSPTTSSKHKEYIFNFIRQYKMLWELKITGNRIIYDKLKNELEGAEHTWIYQKLSKLKKK